jgi:serine/threonine protein kinase
MDNKKGLIFRDVYKLEKQIGKGSFGKVFKVTKKSNGNIYACKIENNDSGKERLPNEYKIYKRFAIKKLDCVPEINTYFTTSKYNILIMELLGKSLDRVLNDYGGKLDLGTAMKIGINIISHMKKIHSVGIIHRDIKPNNFMFGSNENNSKLYVMDFGLSKRWFHNDKHIEYRDGRDLIGTARYASVNIHLGIEPTRRDDMESIGYMLVYLAKGRLPWQGLKKKTKDSPIDKIGERKLNIDVKELCEDLPSCFYEYVSYTRKLDFDQKPDYDYLTKIFKKSASKNDIELEYAW